MEKKSQMKMMETIGIMFVFFILVTFGFIFYAKMQEINYQSSIIEENERKAVEVALRASSLPELQCSSNNIVTDNCLDILKIEAMSSIIRMDNSLQIKYYDSFESSKLVVKQIYPFSNEWIIYQRVVNDTGSFFTPIPISLYDAINNKYYFGVLEVTYYPIR